MSIDYLEQASAAMEWSEDESIDEVAATWFFAKAQAYAAIAQAEQLKRIADMMEFEQNHRARNGEYGYGV